MSLGSNYFRNPWGTQLVRRPSLQIRVNYSDPSKCLTDILYISRLIKWRKCVEFDKCHKHKIRNIILFRNNPNCTKPQSTCIPKFAKARWNIQWLEIAAPHVKQKLVGIFDANKRWNKPGFTLSVYFLPDYFIPVRMIRISGVSYREARWYIAPFPPNMRQIRLVAF